MADNVSNQENIEELIPIEDQESEEDLSGSISFKNAVSQSAD